MFLEFYTTKIKGGKMGNIKEGFYKEIYAKKSFILDDDKYSYSVTIFSDTVEVTKSDKFGKVIESFEENPIFLYKFAEEVLTLLDENEGDSDSKDIIDISDSFDLYYIRALYENGVVIRYYVQKEGTKFETEYQMSFENTTTIRKFMKKLLKKLESAELD